MRTSHHRSRSTLYGALAALLPLVVPIACGDGGDRGIAEPGTARQAGVERAPVVPLATLASTDFPFSTTVTSSTPAFEIKQAGSGIAGRFEVTSETSSQIALDGVNAGSGHALLAWNYGLGRAAEIITSNSANEHPALDVSSQSLGGSNSAAAADIRANNTSSTAPAVSVWTVGQGTALLVRRSGPNAGDLAVFRTGDANVARIDATGAGYFNGGTKSKGADVAEAFEAEGARASYEPGDVLVVSARSDRKVEKASRAYSTAVIGVYATKPGVLLTEHELDERLADLVPVGVIGVIPTKVSAENGVIHRGDLLVSARTPGHAMRGTAKGRMMGAVIGKALAEFRGPGTGVINVLVNVR